MAIDQDIEQIEQLLCERRLSSDEVLLRYALARRLEQLGDFESAWWNYAAANALKPTALSENRLSWEHAYRQHFTVDLIAELCKGGSASDRPVFIVGMPRSGTTLVEQILASHPQVYGAGELHDISFHAESLVVKQSPAEALLELNVLTIERMAGDYIATLDALDTAATHIIDKMPTNFAHLGLIACMFPKARIIHCRRNPLDTCVSCLTKNLDWPFCDMKSLGEYYRGYQQTMELWSERLELKLIEVEYESLVNDTEVQVRRLVDFLALDWDEQCLDFHRSKRTVRTPSRSQVRQPIYGTSLGAWQRYATFLRPLVDAMDDSKIRDTWRSNISLSK